MQSYVPTVTITQGLRVDVRYAVSDEMGNLMVLQYKFDEVS